MLLFEYVVGFVEWMGCECFGVGGFVEVLIVDVCGEM